MRVELLFPLTGSDTVAVDHGHGLYGALKRCVPELEKLEGFGIHTLRGLPQGGRLLFLPSRKKQLRLRLSPEQIPVALGLAGRPIEVLGARFVLGAPQVHLLQPAGNLWARMVTLHFENAGHESARAQLQKHLHDFSATADWEIRRARTIRIHGKQVLGFEVLAGGLTPEESLRLQFEGIGGRRVFGCGIFVRVGTKAHSCQVTE